MIQELEGSDRDLGKTGIFVTSISILAVFHLYVAGFGCLELIRTFDYSPDTCNSIGVLNISD